MTEEIATYKELVEAYNNPVQLDIIINLMVYRELSLTELSNKLGKSKPTVSKYAKKLIDLNVIKENNDPESKEKNMNPYSPKHYILKDLPKTIDERKLANDDDGDKSNPIDPSELKEKLITLRNVELIAIKQINKFASILEEFVKKEKKMIEEYPVIDELLKAKANEEKPIFDIIFISEKYKDKYNDLNEQFTTKLRELEERSYSEDNSTNISNIFTKITFNFEQIIK